MRGLLLAVSVSVGLAGPFQFSGSASIQADHSAISGVTGDTLREPSSEVTLSLNPALSVFGMPLSLELLISTQENNLRQALNKYRIFLKPAELLRQMITLPGFVFSIKGIEIGTCQPNYSSLTLSGVPVTGAAVEFAPWYIYTAAAVGQTQRPVEASDSTDAAYRRMLYAAKFGGGKKEGTHFYLTVLHAKDDPNSLTGTLQPFGPSDTIVSEGGDTTIVQDSLDVVTPNENYLVGAELNLALFEDVLKVESEISTSEITRDNRDSVLDSKKVPNWVENLVKPRLSSSVDFAYSVRPAFELFETRVYTELRMVGPGYRSLGAPTLRNDNLAWGAGIERAFLENQISASASITRERDNLVVAHDSTGAPIRSKQTTTSFTSLGLNLGLAFVNLPYLQLSYAPYFQKSESLNERNDVVSIGAGYSFTSGTLSHSPGISVSVQRFQATEDEGDYNSTDVGLSYSLGFEFPLSISASVGTNQTVYADTTPRDRTVYFDLTPSYTFFGSWQNSLSFGGSYERGGTRYDARLNSSFPVWKIADGSAGIEHNSYRGETGRYNELRLFAGLSKSW